VVFQAAVDGALSVHGCASVHAVVELREDARDLHHLTGHYRDVVAHATAQRVLATRARSVSPVEAAVNSARNLGENLRDFSTLFSLWSRLFDRNG
jgi:hypothetical protein